MSEGAPQPLSNQELQEIQNGCEYKQNLKDRYVGDIDPVTKLRHGQGTYTYHENQFFQYQGFYDNGVKQTAAGQASTLLLRDGTSYTGSFNNGEITGYGMKKSSDGRVYCGEFLEGEMHGHGVLQYNMDKKDEVDKEYQGQFHLNTR